MSKLREAEVLQGKGRTLEEMLRQLGISSAIYHKWSKEYGGLSLDQVRRPEELEQEDSRLRKVVSDLSIYNAILCRRHPLGKGGSPGKWRSHHFVTGKPGQTAPGGERASGSTTSFRATSLPCVGTATINAATSSSGQDGRRCAKGTDDSLGVRVWPLWLSESDSVIEE